MKISRKQPQAKKRWLAPKLIVHGNVEKITQMPAKLKNFGPADDFNTTDPLSTQP